MMIDFLENKKKTKFTLYLGKLLMEPLNAPDVLSLVNFPKQIKIEVEVDS